MKNSFFDQLESQLRNAAREQVAAEQGLAHTARPGRRSWLRSAASRLPLLGAVATTIAVAVLAFALIGHRARTTHPSAPTPSLGGTPGTPPASTPRPPWLLALSARFAVLNGPETKPTSAITKALEVSGVEDFDLRFVHRIVLPAGTVWVAPEPSQVCIAFVPLRISELIGVTCSSSSEAIRGGVRISEGRRAYLRRPVGPQNPLRSWHAGIVPNGIKHVRVGGNPGQIITAQVRDNAFATAAGGSLVRESK